ncbi:type I polyketide synthase [Streptomyces sp. NBC_01462]|uniref:type I polyketide synthase n=1 Tax=Streptomyces sp. NBC_01462 TaxID=2903876 RepID=UPI002E33281D|nr:SDR family NAD(P)-dependent oxidoreductase [Streptomyces sp. NBC_01462]
MNEPVPADARTTVSAHEPVAVVGLACRLPGASGPDAYWRLLAEGRSAITDAPEDRRTGAPHDDAFTTGRGTTIPYRGGFIDAPADFDAAFFGISPREAEAMDPQARLVLELGWEALEHAALPVTGLPHATGVFVGADVSDYAALVHRQGSEAVGHHTATGLNRGLIAGRLSYALGVSGPSLTVDSAQSSSLVAVQLACDSLRAGDCELALAGGVHLNLTPESTLALAEFGGLSPDGLCHTFDARANGFVRGEGAGFVVLKPLARALADGDRIHAVIRGGAVNNDGTGATLTTPDAAAQQAAIRSACARAGVAPGSIDYVELHGTGTRVGDPVEAAALGAAVGTHPDRRAPLAVGSVKTNIGHLEGAAGIAGLLKVVLCLAHGQLVPSLNHTTPNPAIDLDELGLRVQLETTEWTAPDPGRPLRAGVSSFGMGGTNAHLVLEQAPPRTPPAPRAADTARPAGTERPVVPWLLSARSPEALHAQTGRLAAHPAAHADPIDVGWSLLTTRTPLEYRAVGAATDSTGILRHLTAAIPPGPAGGSLDRPVFVFPGQGSQWAGMADELMTTAPAFADRIAECEAALAPHVDWSLSAVLRGDAGAPSLDRSDVEVVQPVLWAVMVSLAALWRAHGVRPAAVVGHSQGEIAAACVAGALSLEDGALAVAQRSKALIALKGLSGMMSVALPEPQARTLIAAWDGRVAVAAVNGPSSVVVSGDTTALDELTAEAEHRGVRVRRIDVDYASHSAHVEAVQDEVLRLLAPLTPRTPEIPFLSTVTGDWLRDARTDAAYWYANLRRPVLLEPAVRTLAAAGHTVFVEVSPHPVLTTPVRETAEAAADHAEHTVVTGTLRRNDGGLTRFYTSLGELWTRGADVDWTPAFTAHQPRTVDLPTYAFQRRRHWIDATPGTPAHPRTAPAAPAHQAPTPATGTGTGTGDSLRLVRESAALILGHTDADAIDPARSFKDLGFDSVTVVELCDRLNRAAGLRLPATVVYEHPTPARLARHLDTAHDNTGAATAVPAARGVVDGEPIAIVSMGCRYPGGVRSPEDLWRLVRAEADVISEFPTDRGWDLDALYDPDPDRSGTSYVREGGFLHDAAEFDAAFFGISPREALAMDPQQRLLLETTWEALERAGIDPHGLQSTATGVFIGATAPEYGPRLHEAVEAVEGHVLTGTTASVASGRIAYTLGLEGPAVTVDTACSSSLVALHMAVQSLRSGECSLAFAGGATVMAAPGMFVEFSRQRGLAANGRCKPFAEGADGTAWAEGVGVLLLERLSDARRNGHEVLAVVRGSAINQDGASNGLTAPNGLSQQRVIRAALANAGLSAVDVDAVEAHGTGTKLGDPIEAQALLATYGQGRDADRPLWLGSVKSNIGHSQAASGVAGVIKMVQAMRHGVLPKSLYADEVSSFVDWSAGAVEVLSEGRPWQEDDRPRRAGVSSFGVSGTNAHVIIEQPASEQPGPAAATEPAPETDEPAVPLLVSARSEKALDDQTERLVSHLRDADLREAGARPVDVAWTLFNHRSVFENRALVIGSEVVASGVAGSAATPPSAVFVFPGQGAQWVGMAVELLDSSPVFAARFGECAVALNGFVDFDLLDVVREGRSLNRVDVVQPVLWAVMVSLAALWESFGVRPSAVVGHSQGEIAAAVVAGALSLQDGARVAALRSRAITALAGHGGMVSVALSRERAEELISAWDGRISVAAVNGPTSVVVSGDADALDELVEQAAGRDVRVRRVEVDYASHSSHVERIREELLEVLAPVVAREPEVPFFSTVTGGWLESADTDAGYWYTNLRRTVQLEPAVRDLIASGHGAFLEMSPHPVLTVPVAETVEAAGSEAVVTGTLRRGQGGLARFYSSLGEAWTRGVTVDWGQAFAGQHPRRVELPTYAFQHQRYWLELPKASAAVADPVDEAFWKSVEDGDLEGFARTLGIEDQESLGSVVPALSSWRKGRQARSTLDSWRYRIVWRPLSTHAPTGAHADGTWLLVVPETFDDAPLFRAVLGALTERTDGVSVLTVGTADSERQRLAERLRAEAENRTFGGVLSLTGLDELPHPEHTSVPRGLAVSLTLVQALGDAEIQAPLWCLTRGAVATADDRAPAAPVQAGVWGLGRVAALEHPKRWGGLIDLPETADESTLKLLVHLLAGEGTEDQIAVRGGKAFGRRLIRAPYGRAPAARSWKPSGTVLVTGGTGALGVRMARWLAGQGAAHLVLTGRRGADTPGTDELRRELEEQGTAVSIVACDMADPDSVTGLIRHLEQEEVPPVRTVVHAAGISALGSLDDAGIADLVSTLSGKVLGADHLDDALDPAALDAVVYFSSISGTWGVADHGAYAAANAILDARAEQRRADGVPVLSVAWGPWAGGGMIAEDLQDTLRRRGVPVIDPDTAVTGLQQALDHDETLIALADVDWRRFAGVFTSVRRSDLLAELPEAQPADDENRTSGSDPAPLQHLTGLDPARRRTALLDLVSRQVATVLGHDSAENIDTELAFKDLGFDSLTAVELRNRLGRTTGLRLPTTVVFDHPSISALADLLEEQAFGSRQDPAETAAPAARGVVDGEPIAIVSMGCRYPGGVRSPEDLWRLVREEADVISEFPTDRGWDLDALYDPDPDRTGTSYVRESGFLQDAAEFDAAFFGISPREALAMDPQQRLLLETTWEALERAGIDPRALRGSSTGVYLGMTDQEYAAQLRAAAGEAEGYLATGAAASVASGRVAYTLGLEGPAVTVDTACSSSLVALHMAVQSLRSGECSLALAGAVTVMSGPGPFIAFSRQRALSRDGRCKPFSAEADGFALSEGVGVLLLERLSDARRNGHEVLAVVRGSAINQDGASNGLTAPNGPSQQRVIQAALANAGLTAQDVDVVEAHGTGTKLGDPIEAQALLATYGQGRDADRPLWLGSVKSNIGHSQAASGVAGVIKMVQAMRHGVLPKSLHADEVSSFVDWSAGAVEVLSEARPWQESEHPRRAGVSSFGISGTNAHVIIEQPEPVPTEPARTDAPDPAGVSVPLLVSARSEKALGDQVERLLSHLRETDPREAGARPVDVAWTLFHHRSVFENRALVIGSEVVASGVAASASSSPSTVFVFPGQGAQWVGMAVELLDSSTVFAARFGECAVALDGFVEWSLMDVVRGVEGAPGLDRVDVVQPVLWAVMVSLAALWESFGVRPSAVVGHSQGEIAAAVVAGALSLQDGARVAALRSRAITALAGHGGMVSVALSRERAEELISGWDGRISVAAVNGPTSVVVSGDADALDELVEQAAGRDVRVRRVEVDYASHSAHVERIREELLEVLAPVVAREPEVPFFSTVTGEWLESAVTDAGYWYTNLRRTVQLEPAVRELIASGHGAFLEMSPHPVLTVPVAETVEAAGSEAVVTGTLRRGQGGLARFYTSLGEAWTRGVTVDWGQAFTPYTPRRVELPTYAFQHQRYWLELPKTSAAADPVDEAFWKSVEDGDLEGFARTLGIDDQESLGAIVPALSSWRRGRRERSTLDSWRYRIVWRPEPEPGTPAPTPDGTWLVAVPETHQDDVLVTATLGALHAAGARTVELSVPDSARRGELAKRLLADLPADVTPDGVLSLLALDTRASEHGPGVSYGLLGTMALVQALDDAAIPGRLWCLTRGAVSTGEGDGAPDPAQAAVWGLARVIGLDDPDRCGGLVDLPAGDTESAVPPVLPALLTARTGGDGGRETEFAVRGGGVSVRRMIRTPLHASGTDADTWRPHGTVLVTGGTGALGSQVARSLAQDGAEHLILTSRRGPEAPGAAALRDELTALGCRVTIAACDVADRTALAALLAQVPDEAPLTAVVHTAGAVETARPLGDLTPEDAAGVMHAKVRGAQNLHDLLTGHPLDAFVLFSSGAGVWGNGGQAPYAAANAHLDALAEQRRAQGLPATSIAWGAWAGGGMVDEEVGEQLLRRGVPAMAPELAVRALAGASTGRQSTLVVADIRWDRFLSAYCAHGHRPLIDEVPEVRELLAARNAARPEAQDEGADAATALLAELAALPEGKRRRRLVDLIRAHVGAVLGHGPSDTVKPGRAFRDMGFDSLTAVELRNRLSGVFGTRLSATIVFDHPTPNALADHLDAELLPAVSGPATDLPAGLHQLEAAYRQASDPAARQALTASLRTLLDTWAASEEPEEATVDEELLAASDEDMFDLIDRELGIS